MKLPKKLVLGNGGIGKSVSLNAIANNGKAFQAQSAKAHNERAAADCYTAMQALNYVIATGFLRITAMMVNTVKSSMAVADLVTWVSGSDSGIGSYVLIQRFEQPTHLQAMVAAGKWLHVQISKANVEKPAEHVDYLKSIRTQWELIATPNDREQPSTAIERGTKAN